MSTMRVYTREFRESAVGMVLSQGLSIRAAAEDLGMPYHTLHSWVRDKRRALRKTIDKALPKTMVDAQARVLELKAEVRNLTLEKDILKKRRRTSRGSSREVRIHSGRTRGKVHDSYGVPLA